MHAYRCLSHIVSWVTGLIPFPPRCMLRLQTSVLRRVPRGLTPFPPWCRRLSYIVSLLKGLTSFSSWYHQSLLTSLLHRVLAERSNAVSCMLQAKFADQRDRRQHAPTTTTAPCWPPCAEKGEARTTSTRLPTSTLRQDTARVSSLSKTKRLKDCVGLWSWRPD